MPYIFLQSPMKVECLYKVWVSKWSLLHY